MAPLLLLPFLLVLPSPYVQAQQNITLGSSLMPQRPSSFWLSPSGDFTFGFRPIDGNTSFYVLAVWFSKSSSNNTVVWYAKTTDPDPAVVKVSSGSRLQLTSNGALSLQDPTSREVWNPQVVGAAYAAMLDTGNFVLAGADGSNKWGTFDNPEDTIVHTQGLSPKMKLHRQITATNYSSGRLLLNLQNNIDEADSTINNGPCGYNGYSSLDATNSQSICVCPPQYSFIDEDRQDKGCKPDFQPQGCDLDEAAATEKFQFISMSHVDWPGDDYEMYTPISEDVCQQLCLTDCFCAVAVFRDSDNTCWKKKMPLSNGSEGVSVQRTVFIKVPKGNSPQTELVHSNRWKKDKKNWILGSSLFLGSSVLVNILLISAIIFGAYCTITINEVPSVQSPLKAFTYAELEKATGRFREVLGTGASGIVYKGQLQDDLGTYIAVKKIDKLQAETEKEFNVEVQSIGQTHHKNLVRLLGFCNEGKERLLVYEYMTNGSLNRCLFGDVKLQWNLRGQIALGVARGLLYLHEECSTQIIHCDIKPQNILLDDNFTAKISDFGLAKLLRNNQTQTNTGVRGTRGYVAPEWFKSIGITAKVDVYSFGVILLELICCRRNVELEVAEEDRKILADWANDCFRCGRVNFLVEGDDEAIFNLQKVERYVAVALWCLQEDPTMRPTMLKVTQMLDDAAAVPNPPDPSSFSSIP